MARRPSTPRQPLHIVKGRPPAPRKPAKGRGLVIAAALALLPATVLAQLGHETALRAYRRAIVELESHKSGASVEMVFERGLYLRDALLRADNRGTTVVEAMSSTDFDALKRELTGFVIGREEAVFANPNPDYFLDLARQFGDAGDRAFFDAYQKTRPSGVWPVWVEQQTDSTACTKFGAGDLVDTYRLWSEFRQSHPHKYRSEVDAFLVTVEDELSGATCACGDSASVLKELETFDKVFPQTRVGDDVRRRIREVREARSAIKFDCTSGIVNRIVR